MNPKLHARLPKRDLQRFEPTVSDLPDIWDELSSWWLVHRAGANTLNWDLALSCAIENRNGLLLVEAKANESELGAAGKVLASKASTNSAKNHARVAFRSRGSWRVLASQPF